MQRVSIDEDGIGRRAYIGLVAGSTLAIAGCLETGDEPEDDEQAEEIEEQLQLNGVVLRSSFPMQLFDVETDEHIAEVHYHAVESHWHYMPLEIPLDGWLTTRARVFDREDEPIPIGPDERFEITVGRTEDTPADLVEVEISSGDVVNFHGVSTGEGGLVFALVEDDEIVWESPKLLVEVVDTDG